MSILFQAYQPQHVPSAVLHDVSTAHKTFILLTGKNFDPSMDTTSQLSEQEDIIYDILLDAEGAQEDRFTRFKGDNAYEHFKDDIRTFQQLYPHCKNLFPVLIEARKLTQNPKISSLIDTMIKKIPNHEQGPYTTYTNTATTKEHSLGKKCLALFIITTQLMMPFLPLVRGTEVKSTEKKPSSPNRLSTCCDSSHCMSILRCEQCNWQKEKFEALQVIIDLAPGTKGRTVPCLIPRQVPPTLFERRITNILNKVPLLKRVGTYFLDHDPEDLRYVSGEVGIQVVDRGLFIPTDSRCLNENITSLQARNLVEYLRSIYEWDGRVSQYSAPICYHPLNFVLKEATVGYNCAGFTEHIAEKTGVEMPLNGYYLDRLRPQLPLLSQTSLFLRMRSHPLQMVLALPLFPVLWIAKLIHEKRDEKETLPSLSAEFLFTVFDDNGLQNFIQSFDDKRSAHSPFCRPFGLELIRFLQTYDWQTCAPI